MSRSVKSITLGGTQGVLIDVECHISNGLPSLIIVGFGNRAVDEARERVRSAFASSGLELPRKRITINLAPADIPKGSSAFDLSIASSILIASKQISELPSDSLVLGELGLDGSVKSVRGIVGSLLAARQKGFKTFYVPAKNSEQALLVPNINVIPIASLKDLFLDLSGTVPLPHLKTGKGIIKSKSVSSYGSDFSHIIGQKRAKRAMEIAAAGSHNVMLSGPPGTGKSMLAKALPSILPPLDLEEVLEVTHLHSLSSKQYDTIITKRPFRSPHHSSSDISIIGGGQSPRPGEISLSHNGVLFFDEFPEFNRSAIEALRQPLEDSVITVARAKDTITFPANFILVATSNPCPCGYYGTTKTCKCMPYEIHKYQRKISGPIIDRIDLFVDVDEVKHDNLLKDGNEEPSQTVLQRVLKARERQLARSITRAKTNAQLTNQDIKRHGHLSDSAEKLLNQAAENLGISARAYMRTIKVARTIADLEGSKTIDDSHISEALQYRKREAI